MKPFLLNFLIMFSSFHLMSAQDKNPSDRIVGLIRTYYNEDKYDELYNLLSADAQRQMPEAAVTDFYQNALKSQLGAIQSYRFIEEQAPVYLYYVRFEKLTLSLHIALNENNKVMRWEWLPVKEETKQGHSKMIQSNNPLKTKEQLMVDTIARAYLQDERNSGISIGIIKDGQTQMYHYGEKDKHTQALPDDQTIYEIGSVTKTFTGILLAHTVNTKKIRLDDDIRKYLPGEYPNLQFHHQPVQVGHLSNHTSRLPRVPEDLDRQAGYDADNPYKHYTREMMLHYLNTVHIDTVPGVIPEYSNYGTALLGIILESVHNVSLDRLLEQVITAPLGMPHTKFTLSEKERKQAATGYGEDGEEAHYWDFNGMEAAGGLKSTLPDMLRYLEANMKESNTDIALSHQQTTGSSAGQSAGLNWIRSIWNQGSSLIWHNGATYGFSSFIGFDKQARTGIVVLSNSGNSVDNTSISILKRLAQ